MAVYSQYTSPRVRFIRRGTVYYGTNEPWRIGDAVSAGCIRLTNDDIIDLYSRAKIGATVVVQR